MTLENPWLTLVALGFGGLGLGLGLVIGAFAVRMLRRYMREEDAREAPDDQAGED